ncbi:MAG: C40 family peptidase [Lachnospiraceae bacterium]|nr:C40 family peptidase [Lachnospiraceae bacterium]
MRRFCLKLVNCILILSILGSSLTVHATSISGIKDKINNKKEEIETNQNHLSDINDQMEGYEGELDVLAEQMDDLNAEIINILASIGVLEEEIAQKELDIADAQAEYDAAVETQKTQEEAMTSQVRLMYMKGSNSLLSLLLENFSFGKLLNRLDYAEAVMAYNNQMLEDYIATKELVLELWNTLETEKASLEADKTALQEQKDYCDTLLTDLKSKSDNYEALYAKAQAEAAAVKKEIQKEQKELKKLQQDLANAEAEEARKNLLNKEYAATDYTKIIDNASGSDIGKKIAKYACQYIGNPYVYGGTSLTKGADCSGFTYRVYKDFGYTLDRTSYAQRSNGKEVAYKDAQPGDLICYSGHIGIYIGGGYIVHASNSKPYPRGGIKVNKATYRTILSVRRIVK